MRAKILIMALATMALLTSASNASAAKLVTVENFERAETDRTMKDYVDLDGFGKFYHTRLPSPLDAQKVVRLNLDTLYSFGVFDLTTPVTITLPDSGSRFMSALIINQGTRCFRSNTPPPSSPSRKRWWARAT
jgi:hypothetical protein